MSAAHRGRAAPSRLRPPARLPLDTKTSDLHVVCPDLHNQRGRRAYFLVDQHAEGPPPPMLRARTAPRSHEAEGSSGCCGNRLAVNRAAPGTPGRT